MTSMRDVLGSEWPVKKESNPRAIGSILYLRRWKNSLPSSAETKQPEKLKKLKKLAPFDQYFITIA